jgi:hypothetical protein
MCATRRVRFARRVVHRATYSWPCQEQGETDRNRTYPPSISLIRFLLLAGAPNESAHDVPSSTAPPH